MKKTEIKTKESETNCDDKHCPVHGSLSVRGRVLEGTVVSSKVPKSATIEFERIRIIPKYERYEKRKTKVRVHNPPCINAKEGDLVNAAECRPISKTKKFVIISIVKKSDND